MLLLSGIGPAGGRAPGNLRLATARHMGLSNASVDHPDRFVEQEAA